jgi:copper chaperone CopZ
MKKHTFEVPALYGDHHVQEVRRILAEIPGVSSVYASSSFQIVEVQYDESMVNDLEIAMKLDEAGYLGEWSAPIEVGAIRKEGSNEKPSFRHTAVYENTKKVVSFAQKVGFESRPLWPCPGMGVIRKDMEE